MPGTSYSPTVIALVPDAEPLRPSRSAEAPGPGEIIPEWCAKSSRNGGRDHLGMMGDIIPESRAASSRNQHK
jgi:hypothetical protein